jgi:hypothetical protein
MRHQRSLWTACVLLWTTATILPVPGLAEEPSGTTIAVLQSAEAAGSISGRRILALQAPVFMGDRISTGAAGEAQLRFRDKTRLVVGPNSQLVIDKFVFKSETSAKEVSINAVRGAFRFITGGSPKHAYSIHTPMATIGVRGTKFDFSVGDDGRTNFVLYEGSARLCDLSGHCVVLSGSCSVAVIKPHGAAERLTNLADRSAVLKSAFPYLRRQGGLGKAFRVDTSSCLVRRAQIAPHRANPIRRASLSPYLPGASPGAIPRSGKASGFGGPISGGGPRTGGGGPGPSGGGPGPSGDPGSGGGDTGGGKCGGSCGHGNNGNGTSNEGNGKGPSNAGGNGNGGGNGKGNHGKS